MKTFKQFAEGAEKIKELINNNKGLQKVRSSVESGNININDLRNFASSDDAKKLKSDVMNMFIGKGEELLNKGSAKLKNIKTKVNK